MIAGIANCVCVPTVVVFRNHVDSRARRAKFGSRRASIRPFASSSDSTGNSSSNSTTTDRCVFTVTAADAAFRSAAHEIRDR